MQTLTPPPSEHLTHPKYRPDIDGLRAIAVLAVVIYHAFPKFIKGGFIGVDIFFVISGFLISTIIMGSLERDSFSFIEFYSRRIKRIFPALILVLITSLVFGWFALLSDEYKQLGLHVKNGAIFLSNFLLWRESGYFDNAAETKPLLHLWSLAIEEQFYIFWPLLLWLTWKKRFNLLTLTIVIAAVSFALNLYRIDSNDLVAAFYSPKTRFWELLIGSILAYITLHRWHLFPQLTHKLDSWLGKIIYTYPPETNGKTLRDVQAILGALLILIGFLLTQKQQFPGTWALLPTLGAVLIISAGVHSWFNRAVLSNRVLVWFGLISFPLYLWHWVLLSFARIMESETPSWQIRSAAVLISIVLAWLTYRYIEKPLRFGQNGKAKTITLLVLMVVVGCTGHYIKKKDGLNFRHPKQEALITQFNYPFLLKADCLSKYGIPEGERVSCIASNINEPPRIILTGDSHSNHLYAGVVKNFSNVLSLHTWGMECSPFATRDEPKCAYILKTIRTTIEDQSVKVVILGIRGVIRILVKDYGDAAKNDEPRVTEAMISERTRFFRDGLKKEIEWLLAKNKKVIFVLDNPELGFEPQTCVDYHPLKLTAKSVRIPCAVSRQAFEERNREYREIVFLC